MPARKPDPPPCRWPGCTSKAAGPHGYCNRDRMRITSSLKVDPRQFTPEQLAGLWAEHQGRSVGRPVRTTPTQCKAPDCTRPARGLGWCEPCRRMLARMALAPETTTPEAFAEARAKRAAETTAKLATPKHHGLPVTTTWPEPAGKLREDLRRAFGMDDGASDDEIVARAEKAVADLAAQAHAAGELVALAERHADAATVALVERDVLAERVAALEAELAALAVPMTEEELQARGDALARAALDREWARAHDLHPVTARNRAATYARDRLLPLPERTAKDLMSCDLTRPTKVICAEFACSPQAVSNARAMAGVKEWSR